MEIHSSLVNSLAAAVQTNLWLPPVVELTQEGPNQLDAEMPHNHQTIVVISIVKSSAMNKSEKLPGLPIF